MFGLNLIKDLNELLKDLKTININDVIDNNDTEENEQKSIIILKFSNPNTEKYIPLNNKSKDGGETNFDVEEKPEDNDNKIGAAGNTTYTVKTYPQLGSVNENTNTNTKKINSDEDINKKIKDLFDQFDYYKNNISKDNKNPLFNR